MILRRCSRSSITCARTSASAGRGTSGAVRQLIDEMERDVQFADSAERLRQPADLPLGLAGLGVPKPFRQHRERLAQPPRGHARLVDAAVLARDRSRELALERPGAAVEEADKGDERFMVGCASDRPNGQYITSM